MKQQKPTVVMNQLPGIELRRSFGMKQLWQGRGVFSDPAVAFSAGRMGMWLLLASLGTLFAATILGYWILRYQASGQLEAAPPLPAGLWLSTLILIVSSGTMHLALLSVRHNNQLGLKLSILASFLLGALFLGSQVLCWQTLIAQHEAVWDALADLPRFMIASFYVLTALHAAHVIGGLIPMFVVLCRSLAGKYDATHHAGVYLCGMYWHFLDIVWIVLFLTLLLGS